MGSLQRQQEVRVRRNGVAPTADAVLIDLSTSNHGLTWFVPFDGDLDGVLGVELHPRWSLSALAKTKPPHFGPVVGVFHTEGEAQLIFAMLVDRALLASYGFEAP